MTRQSKPISYAAILRTLPGTQAEIRDRAGMLQSKVSRLLAEMRQARMVRISGWARNDNPGGVQFVIVYGAGPGEDVEPPPPIPPKDRAMRALPPARMTRRPRRNPREVREVRGHNKALTENPALEARFDLKLTTQREGFKPFRDPLTAAFFGPASLSS